MNWSLIVTLVISALVVATIVSAIVVSVVGRQKSVLGPSGPGSPVGKNCPVLPFSSLVNCDPTKKGACDDCGGATLGYQCYTVNAKNPYTYQVDTTTYNIPDGTWCLPTKVATRQCNEWTGVPILTKISEGKYEWLCDCSKYPDWFASAPGGDCTFETVCGYNADSTKSIGELVCPKGGISGICTEGEPWLKTKNWDPKFGECQCIPGYNAVNRVDSGTGKMIKECVKNSCYPGGTETPVTPASGNLCGIASIRNTCTCDKIITNIKAISKKLKDCTGAMEDVTTTTYKSWIRCPEDVRSEFGQQCVVSPQCIPDPCNPLGYFDPDTCTCQCGPKGDKNSTAINVADLSNPVGNKCVDPCTSDSDTNPCITFVGDTKFIHGTKCYIDSTNLTSHCTNCCTGYYQDSTDHCLNTCIPENKDCDQKTGKPCCPGTYCKSEHAGFSHKCRKT